MNDDEKDLVENARVGIEKTKAGLELTEDEREAVRRMLAEAAAPVFEQIREAMRVYMRAAVPALAQLAKALEQVGNATREDFALAPPQPDEKGRRRQPRRTGRAAQRSPYGPQRRR